jgi:thiamine-monophosphate kinase
LSNEFDLIAQYFSRPAPQGMRGVGDDCAVLSLDPAKELVISKDLLIEGRHFFSDVAPDALGHKALAVNLSDIAAMGATPVACLLGLAIPVIDHPWLQAFSRGFYELAEKAGCPLIGGDTTRSVAGIMVSVTVMGHVPRGQALLRCAAQPGDDIWVTGELGAADVALRLLQGTLSADDTMLSATRNALERPQPPYAFAPTLVGLAHAALDISDGLLQDLGHIIERSGCGARLDYDAIPVDAALHVLDSATFQDAVLTGGDVYQLCFTASSENRARINHAAFQAGVKATRIGAITSGPGISVVGADGNVMQTRGKAGFDHFS